MSAGADKYRDFLILLWQNGLLEDRELRLADGARIEIVRPGTFSARLPGEVVPDFTHAAIRYPDLDLTLYGSIRVDASSSDWRTEGTVSHSSFDSVILHVVADNDHVIVRNERPVVTLVIGVPGHLDRFYKELTAGRRTKGCVEFITGIDPLYRHQILSRVMSDRMNRKSGEILEVLDSTGGDWQETIYIAFMKAFGYKERKKSFERLARSTPYRHLRLHTGNSRSIEAMLLGQAGYLDVQSPDDYTKELQDEFVALRRRYNLLPFPMRWRVESMRPQYMPAQSLARIAVILAREDSFLERILHAKDMYELISIFDIILPEYWQHHYIPSHTSTAGTISYGTTLRQIDLLMINFVIPFRIAYGIHTSNEELREKALDLYESIKPEENSIIRHWASSGLLVDNAFVSQAFIQLTTEYCDKGSCALCPLGAEQFRRLHKDNSK